MMVSLCVVIDYFLLLPVLTYVFNETLPQEGVFQAYFIFNR